MYEDLANAIIVQACTDYKLGYMIDFDFRKFIYSEWFTVLTDCDPDYLYNAMVYERSINDEKRKSRKEKNRNKFSDNEGTKKKNKRTNKRSK